MKAQLKEKQRELTVEPNPLQFLTIRRNVRLREISEQVAAQLQQFSQQVQ
jgi:CRISPR/Cas system CMR subunit Cmr6 (Cas7 group RAMP superfamily)